MSAFDPKRTSALWGPVGAFLAVPILLVAMRRL
jgi:hypothetical protein